MDTEGKTKKQIESEVWSAISAFEQILDAMPTDHMALETLHEAYEQIGDRAQALEYLRRLAQAVLDENDVDTAPQVINKLGAYASADPSVKSLMDKLEHLLVQSRMPTIAVPPKGEGPQRKTVDITNELAMAWNILQAGELTQEEYSSVVHDLSENSSKKIEVPVSVLHVLHDRGFKGLERIIKFLAKDTSTPFISLGGFELQMPAFLLLPDTFARHQGALAFEIMNKDLLVAVLNPYNEDLKKAVRKASNRICHFYLVSADDYDNALNRLAKAVKDAKK